MTDKIERVDLTNCDREPIHRLGAIQPFGFLLVVSSDWLVARASANLEQFVGVSHREIIGRPVSQIIHSKTMHALRNRLSIMRGPDMVERLFGVALSEDGPLFDIALHMSDDQVVIEAEPSQDGSQGGSTASIRSMMARLDQAGTLEAFFREGARQARALTGFDRVMVYRFDDSGAGEVVAEAARSGIGSFLGLHYPASDIPVQARALYTRNLFRIIADVDAVNVQVLPDLDAHGRPIDLSMSILRSVSPIHIEYLKNMGVGASLSISIVIDGKLWGLFACHHYSPRLPSSERRTVSELFGQMFASRLESRERRLALDFETKARQIADRLLTSVADNASLLDDPSWLIEALSDAIPADGIGVWIDGRSALSGLAPSQEQFSELVRILNRNAAGRIFATDNISQSAPDVLPSGTVAGLIAIPISRSPRDYVVLFRQEIVRSVRWAGDPHKPVEYGPNGPRLTPRKSFETWSELVRDRSHPFSVAERGVAETIRVTLIEVVLRLTDKANAARQQANERQQLLIAELNHRVRNILSLISGLIRQSRGTTDSASDFIGHLEGRIQALARAHDQITRDHWAPAPLRALLQAEVAANFGKNPTRIAISGPEVLLAPQAFSIAALVFHELVTNSAKYGSLGDDGGAVTVAWRKDEEGNLLVDWHESGGPPVSQPTRQGFGTTIIRRSIPYELGGKAEVDYDRQGLRAHFCIPAKFSTFVEGEVSTISKRLPQAAGDAAEPVQDKPLNGLDLLLLEDNLIIAMDGEDIFLQLGARSVTLAPNVAQALEAIDSHNFDLGVLDVHLGEETSVSVAEKLAANGIPVIVATGYGQEVSQAYGTFAANVLQKPYTIESVANALSRMLPTLTS
ncbi:two-component system sensor histidine kinase/response regulator [Rhizobium sp. Root1203]|uniref:HWE histidine kinase domain-containing protein n=1 Tax=Rhizobium sp. Root1203 TaxID=1736427 RepID=UPI000710F827|nr:HWE histidine kinase domain-containing protein [Rhizobium sp. Root1203]KQV10772.1 two-component system sensor histidine kinase/response regulator [Rhizobium sp. Root1203]